MRGGETVLAYAFSIPATRAGLLAKGEIVDCCTVKIDSVDVQLPVVAVLDERNVWPSTLQQKSEHLYSLYRLYQQGLFPICPVLQRGRDWVGVHIGLPNETSAVTISNGHRFSWYGGSAVVSEDYVTERNGIELIAPIDVLRLPGEELRRLKDGAIWFAIGFKKNTFRRLKYVRSGYLFAPPDSVTVVNRWR